MNIFIKDLLSELKRISRVNLQDDIDNIDPEQETEYPEIDKLKEFFQLIEKSADLDGETLAAETSFWNTLKNFIINNPSNSIWNESLNRIITHYNEMYDKIEHSTILYDDKALVDGLIYGKEQETTEGEIYYQTFNTEDIRKADAGNSFSQNDDEKWVKPWYNLDTAPQSFEYQCSYDYVRGDDESLLALTNQSNLNFTREQTEELVRQIRLLMPKNSRRVEIEDLNRNFWVIGQVVSGISAYLYGPNSIFSYMFENILKELIQLWENIMYQWVQIALLTLPPIDGIHKEFFPIPISSIQNYKKYDNFDNIEGYNILSYIQGRIASYADKYSRSHLVLIPYIRNNNYQKNYFNEIIIPYICFYNRSKNQWSYCEILNAIPNGSSDNYLTVNPANYSDRIYGAREDKVYLRYVYPLSTADLYTEPDGPFRYYGALRPEVNGDISIDNGQLKIENFTITFTDGIERAVNETDGQIIVKYLAQGTITEETEEIYMTIDAANKKPAATEDQYIPLGDIKAYNGFYLGEIPSCPNVSSDQERLVYQSGVAVIGDGKLFKVGNYMPQGYVDYLDNPLYYAEQINPSGQLTDYLLNITIPAYKEGADINVISSLYGPSMGASPPALSYQSCYLYAPKIENGIVKPWLVSEKLSNEYTEADYKQLGKVVLRDYLSNTRPALEQITYFMGAVGYQPWHSGLTGRQQGYFSTNILTHLFRFVPIDWAYLVDEETEYIPIFQGDKKIGILQTLGIINKIETAFGTNVFAIPVGASTTWRLPQLTPEEYVGQLLIYKEAISGKLYFVDVNKDESGELAQCTIEELTNKLNLQLDYYKNIGVIIESDDIKITLTDPSGLWSVFDGNITDTTGNSHFYKRSDNLREVAYTNFKFDSNGKIQFTEFTKGRYIGDQSSLTEKANNMDYTGDYIMPSSGSDNMQFTW